MAETTLPYEWVFWVIKTDHMEYEIEKIVSFSTVEKFWEYYMQFPAITSMKRGGIGLFKKGITPAWEDPANSGGISLKVNSFGHSKEEWDRLVLLVIGGTLEAKIRSATLHGIYTMAKPGSNSVIVELWFGRAPGPPLRVSEAAAALGLEQRSVFLKSHPLGKGG
jgi:hypothetical protein